jgi:hypothetical protein
MLYRVEKSSINEPRRGTDYLMADMNSVVEQLREERSRIQQDLEKLDAALKALEGTAGESEGTRRPVGRPRKTSGKRIMSADARARIAAAQRARWAKQKRTQSGRTSKAKTAGMAKQGGAKKRTMSADARARIAAAQRARWAKARSGQ